MHSAQLEGRYVALLTIEEREFLYWQLLDLFFDNLQWEPRQ